jgi:succinate-semialdehyde dehydrogenase/glutarate-semialdehyde dehydrogenase
MQMFIGGKFVDSSDGKTGNIVNPATGKVIDTIPMATQDDIKRAVDLAVEAQVGWANTTVRERTKILRKFAAAVLEKRLELGKVLSLESGKPYMAEAVWEFDSVSYVFEGACEVAKHHYGATMPMGTEPGYDEDLQLTWYEPLGVIACIVPFNFPAAIWAFKVAGALAAGNAVLVKAPSYNPLAVLTMHKMLHDAGVPAGVAQCITGEGAKLGNWLVGDPRVASVNFTGGSSVGIDIAKVAADNLTPYYFELGGNDPFIVYKDADIDLVVKEAGDQARNARQCCTGSKRFIIHNSLKDIFVKRLIDEYLKPIVMGDPMDPTTTMGPVISERAARNIEAQVNLTVSQGAKIAYGGKRNGAFYDPTIIVDVRPDMDIARDMEVFGPVWPVIGFDTIEEAVQISNSSKYGLGGCIFSSNIKTCLKVAKALRTGHVGINGSGNFRAAECPFGGGKKMSGNSRESLSVIMEEVTQRKSVIFRYVFKD